MFINFRVIIGGAYILVRQGEFSINGLLSKLRNNLKVLSTQSDIKINYARHLIQEDHKINNVN